MLDIGWRLRRLFVYLKERKTVMLEACSRLWRTLRRHWLLVACLGAAAGAAAVKNFIIGG